MSPEIGKKGERFGGEEGEGELDSVTGNLLLRGL